VRNLNTRRGRPAANRGAVGILLVQRYIVKSKFSSPWERSIQIQLKLPSDSPREGPATRIITAVASSAIRAGPALGMSFNCRKIRISLIMGVALGT
jgi:hypothetical protein